MGLAARIVALNGPLPTARFTWDAETEILSGHLDGVDATHGLTGSIELEGKDGSFIVLDVSDGVVRGLEIVVWPRSDTVGELAAPEATATGRLSIPTRTSQPGIAAVELETVLAARKSADESTLHLRVGNKRKVTVTRLADRLLLETDRRGEIAGFWLLGVPRFEATGRP